MWSSEKKEKETEKFMEACEFKEGSGLLGLVYIEEQGEFWW